MASCMQNQESRKSSLALAKWPLEGAGPEAGGAGGRGWISVVSHWPRQDLASQAELPLGSWGSVGHNNFHAPLNNRSTFHLRLLALLLLALFSFCLGTMPGWTSLRNLFRSDH